MLEEVMAEWQQQQLGDTALDSMGNNLASKRQRRPSVRLGEIGDQPAAILSESNLKRKKQLNIGQENSGTFPCSPTQPGQGDSAGNSDGNGAVDSALVQTKLGKVAKTRPVLYVTDGIVREQNSASLSDEGQGHDMLPDPMSCYSVPLEQDQSAFQPNSSTEVGGIKSLAGSKFSSKRGRNGKRRKGSSKGLPAIEKLRRVIPSIIEIGDNENERASGMDETADPLSDEPYDADTPEGFRDCDLQLSEEFTDPKETSKSLYEDQVDATILSDGALIHENAYESSLQAGMEDECIPGQEDNAGEDREGSANIHVSPSVGAPRELFESLTNEQIRSMPQVKVKPLLAKTRPMSEANGCLVYTGPQSDNENKQVERLQPKVGQVASLTDGVNGWLSTIGLGKYAPVFEAHEVDIQVLPFLTLDDLRWELVLLGLVARCFVQFKI